MLTRIARDQLHQGASGEENGESVFDFRPKKPEGPSLILY